MLVSDFDYQLPPELIAQNPAEPRESARLLVYTRSTGEIVHATVADLATFLPPETHIVVNNSKVRHSRLTTDSGREVLLLQENEDGTLNALSRGKSPKTGDIFTFQNASVTATVVGHTVGVGMTTITLSFSLKQPELASWLETNASLPLPPYISKSTAKESRYQTVFAKDTGSAAAPTAGLHFSEALIERLLQEGHSWNEVTLHVGLGTFLPLRAEKVEDNTLHSEVTYVTADTAQAITQAVLEKKPVLAVGTTSFRTLESHWDASKLVADTRETNLFTYPGYRCAVPTMLFTNFHLPKSSLLLLVSAFLGNTAERTLSDKSPGELVAELHRIYAIAIAEKYRFFSFGDAMLIR